MAAVEQQNTTSDERQLTALEYQQVCRLHLVMSESIRINGRPGCNFPTLVISMHSLVETVCGRLAATGVTVKDVRLNGGAASYVLQSSGEKAEYNDLDLIFRVDLSRTENGSDRVKEAVLSSLYKVFADNYEVPQPICGSLIEDAYVRKMVKVSNDVDCWSLMSLTNESGHHVELKFVDRMRRQFEFSVDAFQIILDNLLTFYSSELPRLDKCSYPRILAESIYGPFEVALSHLNNKLIATHSPEQIRGGGLLKYCYLQARGYRTDDTLDFQSMEKYMCSRFFIDFPDVIQQQHKLENYLEDHFSRDDDRKSKFLSILYSVVQESTVCLMGQERRQTLDVIGFLQHRTATNSAYGSFHPSWNHGNHTKRFFRGKDSAANGMLKYSFPSLVVSVNRVPFVYYPPYVAYS